MSKCKPSPDPKIFESIAVRKLNTQDRIEVREVEKISK